jgi:hypothetical protein
MTPRDRRGRMGMGLDKQGSEGTAEGRK